jgi:hypothetical protein
MMLPPADCWSSISSIQHHVNLFDVQKQISARRFAWRSDVLNIRNQTQLKSHAGCG